MTWSYRIIEFAEHRALHEVHYNRERKPVSYTENAISFVELLDEDDGIDGGLEMALLDVRELPILPVGVFEIPIARRPPTPRRVKDHGTSA